MENATHVPTIQELVELPSLETAQISPDGRFVAYEQKQPDWEEDRYVSQIWLVAADGESEPQQITFSPQGSRQPRWSPDGSYLAFISKREGDKVHQIYRLSPAGGEAARLSQAETDIQQFRWAPDGQSLAFTAADPQTEADKKREKSFGQYQVEDEDYQYTHLWQLTLPDKKHRKLTTGREFTVMSLCWSPDSRFIAFAAPPTPDMADYMQARIFQIEVASLQLAALTPAGYTTPFYAPDGRFLFCQQLPEYFFQLSTPCLINLDTGDIQPVDAQFGENIQPLAWSDSGLIFSATQRTNIHLFQLDPHSGEFAQRSPDLDDGWTSGAYLGSCTADGRLAALVMGNAAQLNEVTLLNLETGAWRNLTNLSTNVNGWPVGRPEPYQWSSSDGTPIEGVLIKPADFDPQQKYPLLVIIHGGPTWASFLQKQTHYSVYPHSLWLAKGAIILQPNYRGGIGYGADFRALNVRNLGLGDYADVISGVDALIAAGWVDASRIGAMGWSQGGYISMFIATYSDRFVAISAGAGISNWVTYYANTDIQPFTRHYLKATPWEEMDIYAQTSPMTYIKTAQTPTLIQHGRSDARVPLPNAYELYQGLRDMDVPVRLVTYPGMPHGPRKPRQYRHLMQDNLEWFNHWIWQEPADEAEKRPCYIGFGTPEQLDELHHWARRDGADCRFFSASAGLVETDPGRDAPPSLTTHEAAKLADTIAHQLEALSCRELIFYSPPAEKQPAVQSALGCLHLAAAQIGGLPVKHEEVAAWGDA